MNIYIYIYKSHIKMVTIMPFLLFGRSALQLCGSLCSERLREALRQKAPESGIEELMAEELAKAAAARLTRTRTASPRPQKEL